MKKFSLSKSAERGLLLSHHQTRGAALHSSRSRSGKKSQEDIARSPRGVRQKTGQEGRKGLT